LSEEIQVSATCADSVEGFTSEPCCAPRACRQR
jgi:hypothetical protein